MRFRLRALLVVVTVLAVLAAAGQREHRRAMQQKAAVAKVRRAMGDVQYRDRGFGLPRWLMDRLGRDFFAVPVKVSYFETGAWPTDRPEYDDHCAALQQLSDIREVDVFDSAFPIEMLPEMPKLVRLRIEQNGLGDEDIETIAKLKQLEEIHLAHNRLTDRAVEKLGQLGRLKHLDLRGNPISEAAIGRLQQRLPDCHIEH